MSEALKLKEHVYTAIDSERDYQDNLSDNRSECKTGLSQMDRLGLIQVCLNRAMESWYAQPGKVVSEVSEQLRKIAALCVQDGEQNGMNFRQQPTKTIKVKNLEDIGKSESSEVTFQSALKTPDSI